MDDGEARADGVSPPPDGVNPPAGDRVAALVDGLNGAALPGLRADLRDAVSENHRPLEGVSLDHLIARDLPGAGDHHHRGPLEVRGPRAVRDVRKVRLPLHPIARF